MKSEVRVGRLRGSGAIINLTGANQIVGGLSFTLDVPKGCGALCTITAMMTNGANSTVVAAEVDGVEQGPPIVVYAANGNGSLVAGAATFMVPSGRHAVRVNARASSVSGQVTPSDVALSWLIAPLGGIAS